jgi:CBS domain-containing protein
MHARVAGTQGPSPQPGDPARADDPRSPEHETYRLARDEYERPLYRTEADAAAREEPQLAGTGASSGDEAAAPFSSLERMRAEEVMTPRVASVRPATSVERAARLMAECDCGALPVIGEDGLLVGIVTDRDIALRVVARGRDSRKAIIADCMTERVFACYAHESLAECMRQMARHQVRRLPIVNERGQLVGIVAQSDLARHVRHDPEAGEHSAIAELMRAVSEPG